MGRFNKEENADNKEVVKELSAFSKKRNEKKAIVKAWLDSKPNLTPDTLEAIKYLAGMGSRSQAHTVNTKLKEMLVEAPRTLIEIFTAFDFGIPTMDKKIREFIKLKPEDRIWVAFDAATKTYSVAGTGENPPEDWTGYLPIVETAL